jgi:hypothetical protein
MKILTFRRFIGLAALGGFAYVHRQRGGEWTMASIKDTLRHLWSSANRRADEMKEQIKDQSKEMRDSIRAGSSESGTRSNLSESSSRAYGYGRRDDDRNRH